MRIALLEDDPDQVAIMSLWLQDSEHSVTAFGLGAGFLRGVRRDSYDLYILDWMLPDTNGLEVLARLRSEMQDFTPVLIATSKNAERDVVQALETGADDYLVKPIRQRELLARVSALWRRAAGGRPEAEALNVAPYMLDTQHKRATLNDEDIALTSREFDLATFFFRNAGRVVSRAHILEAIWGIENADVSTRTVDTHISRLRKKLQLTDLNGWKLSAIYQDGYRLERNEAALQQQQEAN